MTPHRALRRARPARPAALAGALALLLGACSGGGGGGGGGGGSTPPAPHLAFDPIAGASADATLSVTVRVLDAAGAAADGFTSPVTLSIASGPAGAALGGTSTATPAHGVATFAVTLRKAAGAYVLRAQASGADAAQSAAFALAAGAPAALAFAAQPADAVAGATLAAVTVQVQDAWGNATPSSATVQLAAAPGAPGALLGTTSAAAAGGLASFAGLSIEQAGAYALQATSPPLSAATSAAFTISPAAPAALVVAAAPSAAVAGEAFQVDARVVDAFGNPTVASAVPVTATLSPAVATLLGTTTVPSLDGVATFVGLSIERAAAGLRVAVDAPGLTGGQSAPFDVSPAAPHHLAFQAEPTATAAGVAIAPAPAVAVLDAFENLTGAALDVAMGVASATAPGAALGGTTTVTSAAGVATFADLRPNVAGTWSLRASAAGLVSATSVAFAVTGTSAALVYTPRAGGRIGMTLAPASTAGSATLQLVALEPLAGYSLALNLPLDATRVQAAAPLFTAGPALALGSGVVAAGASLPAAGPLAGVVVSGASQKRAGAGAVATDAVVPAGTVFYSLTLDLAPGAVPGVVFDGATFGGDARFRAALRDRLGSDVVGAADFAIGRLDVVLQ